MINAALARVRKEFLELQEENIRLREENMLLYRRLGEIQDAVARQASTERTLGRLQAMLPPPDPDLELITYAEKP